jgi:EamA domain-containing membrane protein RarD
VYDDDIEKSAAAPEVLEMIASLEPVESLTTVAVTPRSSLLIAVARSARVSPVFPLPVAIVTAVPLAGVIVMDEVGRVAVELVSMLEYQAPVLAILLTTTVWEPAAVPEAAVAVISLVLEDVTVRCDNGPARLFSDSISV